MRYVRLSENYNNNILIPAEDSPYKHIKNKNKPHFISMANYTQEQYETWKKTNTLSGISGSKTNRFWADFDAHPEKGVSLEQAFKDAKTFYERLIDLGMKDSDIQLSFTGNKGVGIIIETDSEFTNDEVKTLCLGLGQGLQTFDRAVYDNQRILRLLFTINEKSGLYKIPITYDELNEGDVKAVKALAADIEGFPSPKEVMNSYTKFNLTNEVRRLMTVSEKKESLPSAYSLDLSTKPQGWRNCKWSLLQGNFKAGERHNALMTIASTLKGMGYDKDAAYYLCKSALKKQASLTKTAEFDKKELYENVINSVYDDHWNGGQYTCKKDGWLKDYCNKLDVPCSHEEEDRIEPKRISDATSAFKDFVVNIDKNTIKTGLKELDKRVPLTIGMNLGIVGSASSGKTMLALEILKNTSKEGVVSVFASLDMHRVRLFEKLMYKVGEGISREELYSKFQNNEEGELLNKLNEDYKNVYFYDRSSPTINEIRKYIDKINSESPTKVKLVMIDYFERLNSERSDETAASKDIAGQLQDLVNDYNICLITLVQPNKFSIGSGPDTPILSYTAIKGSSFLYQSFRSIVSIWRPFFNPETSDKDKYLQMGILKNDLGELGVLNYVFEGRKGTIREFASPEERRQLDLWLEEKENNKKAKKTEDWE